MNREIRFKGWDTFNKVWLKRNGKIDDHVSPWISNRTPQYIVVEFTGRLDKNGKEIYKGDILRDDVGDLGIVRFGELPLDKAGDCVCTYLAFYVECRGQIGRAPTYECVNIGDWMEIIGNVFENLELEVKDAR